MLPKLLKAIAMPLRSFLFIRDLRKLFITLIAPFLQPDLDFLCELVIFCTFKLEKTCS